MNEKVARRNYPPSDDRCAKSLADLTRENVNAIAELEQAAETTKTIPDRMAAVITRFAGSMRFVYLHVIWFGLWIVLNSLPILPASWRIDPFPFLTFVVSLEAIFLSTFILITQNHEELLAARRSHLDLQINLLSEQENSKMLAMLDAIQQHLGISQADPDVQMLEEATRPEKLAGQIKKVVEQQTQSRCNQP